MVGVDAGGAGKMNILTYDTDENGMVDVIDVGVIDAEQGLKVASDDLQHSIDAIDTVTVAVYEKQKTLTFTNGIKGTIRIKFNIYNPSGYWTHAFLTKNGVVPGGGSDLGVEQSTQHTSGEVKSQDIAVDLVAGETIDLWVHTQYDPGEDGAVKELRFYYSEEINVAVTGGD